MPDEGTDAIAREAARLIATGRESEVVPAIRTAAHLMGRPGPGYGPWPSPGAVRAHLRGMSQQAQGLEGYQSQIRRVWSAAEELMTVLEEALPIAETVLVGRAAEGKIDGGVTVHVRLYTDAPTTRIAELLVDHGYDEPSFMTAETRFGRLDRIGLVEEIGPIVITRCMPRLAVEAGRDLFSGQQITNLRLGQLRSRLLD